MIDLERAKRNRIKLDDIVETLESLNVKLSQDDLNKLKDNLIDARFEIVGDKIVLKPYVYLADILKNFVVRYDKANKRFIIRPMDYFDILKKLKENGLEVMGLDLSFQDFDIEFTGNLRYYQEEAIKSWVVNNFRGVIALPTGAGKTIIGVKALELVRKNSLIVTFTKEQMFQWREAIIRFTKNRPEIGLYYSEEKKIRPITITTYHTAYRHISELKDKFYLLIIDEAHHLPADKFKVIAENIVAPTRMGLSATPYRDDGKHEELFKIIGGVVYFKSTYELVKQGYLASYDIIQRKVKLTIDERKKYLDLLNKFKKLSNGRKISELITLAKQGNENAIEAMKIYNEIKKVVNFASGKIKELEEILKNEKGKILIFTQYVDQAEEIAKKFNALLLTGKMSKEERKRVLTTFKNMSSGILVLTTVGDEGIDIPDANVGIIVTGTGSRRQFIQRLGRILRPYDGKQAKLYEIIVSGTSEEYQARRRKETEILSFDQSDELDDM